MIPAGIIAEFDPFHNGHKYLIEKARENGSTHIAVVMSGSAVQRGAPAFLNKYFRAETAVKNGADLILEMPAPYSCSNAETFAKAGITALASLGKGFIKRLYFGSETDNTALLQRAAAASLQLKDSPTVRRLLKQGASYPSAVYKACRKEYGDETASALESPNSTLAVEYCKAISLTAPEIEPFAVLRTGTGHDCPNTDNGFASGSKLREMILQGKDTSEYMPFEANDYCNVSKLDTTFLYRLMTAQKEELLGLPDMNEALCNRILKARNASYSDTESFLEACKAKNITAAKLRRTALHLVLGINKSFMIPLPYLKILAFNKRGAELLQAADPLLPIGTSPARLEKLSAGAQKVAEAERNASILRSLGTSSGRIDNEYTRKIQIINTF